MRGDGQRSREHVRQSAFYRLGTFGYRRRWWILAIWVVVLILGFAPLSKLTDRLSQGGFEVPGSQSDEVKKDIDRYFTDQFEFTDLLVMRSTLTADDPAFHRTF